MGVPIGTLNRFSAVFVNSVTRHEADPTTINFILTDPLARSTYYTYGNGSSIVKDTVGNYHIDISLAHSGVYGGRWFGSGTVQAGATEVVYVDVPPVAITI